MPGTPTPQPFAGQQMPNAYPGYFQQQSPPPQQQQFTHYQVPPSANNAPQPMQQAPPAQHQPPYTAAAQYQPPYPGQQVPPIQHQYPGQQVPPPAQHQPPYSGQFSAPAPYPGQLPNPGQGQFAVPPYPGQFQAQAPVPAAATSWQVPVTGQTTPPTRSGPSQATARMGNRKKSTSKGNLKDPRNYPQKSRPKPTPPAPRPSLDLNRPKPTPPAPRPSLDLNDIIRQYSAESKDSSTQYFDSYRDGPQKSPRNQSHMSPTTRTFSEFRDHNATISSSDDDSSHDSLLNYVYTSKRG
jgi:hypothetical protein